MPNEVTDKVAVEQFAFRCTKEEGELIRQAIDVEVAKIGRRPHGKVYNQQDFLKEAVVNKAKRLLKGRDADGKKT